MALRCCQDCCSMRFSPDVLKKSDFLKAQAAFPRIMQPQCFLSCLQGTLTPQSDGLTLPARIASACTFTSTPVIGNHKLAQMLFLRWLSLFCSTPVDLQEFWHFQSTSGHFEVYYQAGGQIKETSLMLNPGGKEMYGHVSAGSYIYALFLPHNTEICDFKHICDSNRGKERKIRDFTGHVNDTF